MEHSDINNLYTSHLRLISWYVYDIRHSRINEEKLMRTAGLLDLENLH